jgi:metallophosphoesterase (TIGR00282 family)
MKAVPMRRTQYGMGDTIQQPRIASKRESLRAAARIGGYRVRLARRLSCALWYSGAFCATGTNRPRATQQTGGIPVREALMRIAFLGDVVGRPGRAAVKARLPFLREKLRLNAVIANAENTAGGIGATRETLRELFGAGVDVATGGNHTWRNREFHEVLDEDKRIIRPANAHPESPGRGHTVRELPDGARIAVINLLGRAFMDARDCPFRAVDAVLEALPSDVTLRFVDFHAEATSEKRAMGHHLDGRVSALVGTHTHVQTADATIFPKGMAYITDLGMCGAERESALGMEPAGVIKRFVTGLPVRFKPAAGEGTLSGLVAEFDPATGRALNVAILRERAPLVYDPAARHPGAVF